MLYILCHKLTCKRVQSKRHGSGKVQKPSKTQQRKEAIPRTYTAPHSGMVFVYRSAASAKHKMYLFWAPFNLTFFVFACTQQYTQNNSRLAPCYKVLQIKVFLDFRLMQVNLRQTKLRQPQACTQRMTGQPVKAKLAMPSRMPNDQNVNALRIN